MQVRRVGVLAVGLSALLVLIACRPLLALPPLALNQTPPTPSVAPDPSEAGADGQVPLLGKARPPGGAARPALPPVPPLALPPGPFAPPGPLWSMPPGTPGALATPAPSSGIRQTLSDIAYGGDNQQRLDLYVPAREEPVPMLLFIHGGAWSSGDKSEYGWLGVQLAQQGMLVAVANYRLSPAVQHPQHALDVAAAAAWLYRHGAEYGGDPQRLYLAGHSAGAHLVSLVALDSSYLAAAGISEPIVAGVAGFAGAAYDIDARYASTPLAPLFVPAFGQDPSRWADAAPLRYVKPGAPPFLLVHGLMDNQAPAASAQTFAAALQQQGVPTTLYLLPQLDHFTALLTGITTLPTFVRNLSDKPTDARRPQPARQAGPSARPGPGTPTAHG
ncbi:MAG: alpha/beta hydrolase [Chloroflexi bacterium]|nr:alpha/beta hydrolase [Chloroflexota bacterium]